MDYTKFKPKQMKWMEYALILAVVIMIIGAAFYINLNKEETATTEEETTTTEEETPKNDYLKYLIPIGIVLLLFLKTKNTVPPAKTVEEIIKFVADTVYIDKGIYLDTSNSNVRAQRGAPEETYVEFLTESLTYLYLEGIGIIEKYPGESIKDIRKAKEGSEIDMTMAKQGLSRKERIEGFEDYNRTEELL